MPDTIPASTGTTATISIGGTFSSALDTPGDRDWIRLDLTAGQEVAINLDGAPGVNSLYDPYLYLHDSDGMLIASNDDSGLGTNSQITVTAGYSGAYYIDVGAFGDNSTGDYVVSVQEAGASLPGNYDPLESLQWGVPLADTHVTVHFGAAGFTAAGYTSDGFRTFETLQFRVVFDLISSLTHLTFSVVDDPEQADFQLILDVIRLPQTGYLGTFIPPGEIDEGVGVFNGEAWDRWVGGDLEQGGYGFATILHEVLHGLGMAHPHDSGGTSTVMPGVTSSFFNTGTDLLNQGVFTVMGYNRGFFEGPVGTGHYGSDWGYEAGPMALDIAVLQRMYGANTGTNTGDDTYVLPDANVRGTGWVSIWDSGGIDTIRHDGTRTSTIDLRAATLLGAEGGGGYISARNGITGGFTIANGVVIENAIGGSGSDMLNGNAAANSLRGRAGSDTIIGGMGDDSIDGGANFDTAVLGVAMGTIQVTGMGSGWIGILSAEGADVFLSIESFEFSDGTLSIAQIMALAVGGSGQVIEGTPLHDPLYGTIGDDTISGFDGNDTIYGDDGNDLINGGAGDDSLLGGLGADEIHGATGNDTISGLNGFDAINGGAGDDSLNGGQGNDTLLGGDGNDHMIGGLGFDEINGGTGDDTLYGLNGFDLLSGGAGNDSLNGGSGNDTLRGGDGNDHMTGGLGFDEMDGGAGNDTLYGLNGFDLLNGGAGDDRLNGGSGNDTLFGATGNDTLIGGLGFDILSGGGGDDILLGQTGFDRLNGGAGNDDLQGNAGNDTLMGGQGDDILRGGQGADLFIFQSGADVIRDFQNDVDSVRINSRLLFQESPVASDLGGYSSVISGNLMLDFGRGNTLTFNGLTNVTALYDDVIFA
ncbi:M10 family metallopeptidase C-terminal domain-containing protein [Oceaniovalibus sp. ACAM 378]|uniref:pre-peptidase C-terminal domain-containing protein n=1 Tax=Oceaniovalibus sp. ACAM 378 TaxID=2599923 RepID=UPI0011D85A1D|nr:M10 family metallopeptidase C-terminal domain-containing protein [Oceaniovalibus sp. ACAM 378]TYB84086.1 hypothetical protein FQ320_22925 [Oceaniovalibus sp. ACAM 378]